MKGLIVEDNKDFAEQLRQQVEHIFTETTVVGTKAEAEAVLSGNHNVIFFDLALPDSPTAEATLRWIINLRLTMTGTIFIVISGYATDRIKNLAKMSQIDAIADKLDMDVLNPGGICRLVAAAATAALARGVNASELFTAASSMVARTMCA